MCCGKRETRWRKDREEEDRKKVEGRERGMRHKRWMRETERVIRFHSTAHKIHCRKNVERLLRWEKTISGG